MASPVKEYSLGHCKAAVFKSEQYDSYSVKLQKSYKDKQGNWKNTEYFNLPDLRDLHNLVLFMINKQVKESTPGATQGPTEQSSSEEIGW